MDQRAKAEGFRKLHTGGDILLLPNAWDAASAVVLEAAGAKAIGTSSAAVAWSHGYPDGNRTPFDRVLATVQAIARVVAIPVTVDMEGGYTDDPRRLRDEITRLVEAGAVGVNLEDGTGDPALLARKIEAARAAADMTGVHLFINARTDVFLRSLAEGHAAFTEAVKRAGRYQSAGADGVFIPKVSDEDLIGRLAGEVRLPLNIMGWAGIPAAPRLQALGVRRLSTASLPFRAAYASLGKAASAFLASGDPDTLATAGDGFLDLQGRFMN